jgi:hypothetical protein
MSEVKTFRCARCGMVNPDWLSFGVGDPTRREMACGWPLPEHDVPEGTDHA